MGWPFRQLQQTLLKGRLRSIVQRLCTYSFFSLIIVIVNLGMPLDYKSIAGAGLFTFVYIVSRALRKIGGAYLASHITKCEKSVQKSLGLTLLPHSGVSLVFTGIAVSTLQSVDSASASII